MGEAAVTEKCSCGAEITVVESNLTISYTLKKWRAEHKCRPTMAELVETQGKPDYDVGDWR
jgi:hypothetical protein